MRITLFLVIMPLWLAVSCAGAELLDSFFTPPPELKNDFGNYSSLLLFNDGRPVRNAEDWKKRRQEILSFWTEAMGEWPPLLEKPRVEIISSTNRENFVQHKVKIEISRDSFSEGYLLTPSGPGPFPGIVVPYYEPESSIGVGKVQLRDFGYQLARRGFVTLSIGSPGGDARKPDNKTAEWQPLSYLAYISANCANALSSQPQVDRKRLGIVGHSYGGKWAMFSMALSEKFACGVWSDPGIVFDETRSNVNYWEPWYLGKDRNVTRKPGVPKTDNPRTGPYKMLFESGHDLHEILALIAPRPFLVSGGAEDQFERWRALNRVAEVYELLGYKNRIAMTSRPHHDPTVESNEQIYRFFEKFLGSN